MRIAMPDISRPGDPTTEDTEGTEKSKGAIHFRLICHNKAMWNVSYAVPRMGAVLVCSSELSPAMSSKLRSPASPYLPATLGCFTVASFARCWTER